MIIYSKNNVNFKLWQRQKQELKKEQQRLVAHLKRAQVLSVTLKIKDEKQRTVYYPKPLFY